jgi:SAM-dependent methyltransferase
MSVDVLRRDSHSWDGVRQIVRFNWPRYAMAALVVGAGAVAAVCAPWPIAARWCAVAAASLATFWTVASLFASWIVYDCSSLRSATWLPAMLPSPPRSWIAVHAGVDDLSPALRTVFGKASGRTIDIFDPAVMTEPSIRRARMALRHPWSAPAHQSLPRRAEPTAASRLAVAAGSVDLAVLALAAHELRAAADRVALFQEIRRVLTPGGRAVVAEHLRDWPNVVAFGPGALHFHSRHTWLQAFTQAGLAIDAEHRITPFVAIFVLRSQS